VSTGNAPNLSVISAAADGSVFGADKNGVNYRQTSSDPVDLGTWEALASSVTLTQIAATSAADVWGVTAGGAVHRSQGATWDPRPVAGNVTLTQLSAAADGTVWGVSAGVPYQYTGAQPNPWEPISSETRLAMVAVGEGAAGESLQVFGLGDGQVLQYAGSSTWEPVTPAAPVALVDISVSADGLLWGVGSDDGLYLYLGPAVPWLQAGTSLQQISAGSASNIWALDIYGDPRVLQFGDAVFTDETTAPPGVVGWETESVYDPARSTHLWIVYQAATLAGGPGGSAEGQAAKGLVNPQPLSVKGPVPGDPFHNGLCQGLYDADNIDPWRDLPTFFQWVPWLGKLAATYKSHFYHPETGRNWRGDTDPTALTRGRSVAAFALQCYLAGDMSQAGYYLGIALHYLTDVTQPMHAANFTHISSDPWGWHSAFEKRVMGLTGSGGVSPPARYTPTDLTDWDSLLVAAATNAKNKYFTAICPQRVFEAVRIRVGNQWVISKSWQTEIDSIWSGATPSVRSMLADAITFTSQFLVAWTTMAQAGTEVVCLVSEDTGGLITNNSGRSLSQGGFSASPAQQWIAVPLVGPDDGYHQITSRSSSGGTPIVLDVSGERVSAGSQVIAHRWKNQDNQKWQAIEGPSGTIRWKGKQSGLFLTVSAVSNPSSALVIQDDGRSGQDWILAPAEVDTLGCAAGSLIADVPHGTLREGVQLQLFNPKNGSNQHFQFVPVANDPNAPADEVFVILVASSGMTLDVSVANQVIQEPWAGTTSQRWRRTAVAASDTTLSYLENVAHPGWFLSAETSGTTVGDLLVIAPSNGGPMQRWRVTAVH
jgi:hypothetical protein